MIFFKGYVWFLDESIPRIHLHLFCPWSRSLLCVYDDCSLSILYHHTAVGSTEYLRGEIVSPKKE